MEQKKQPGRPPEENDMEDSTIGFEVVKEKEISAEGFLLKKRQADGQWEDTAPVHVAGKDTVEVSKQDAEETTAAIPVTEEDAAAGTEASEEIEQTVPEMEKSAAGWKKKIKYIAAGAAGAAAAAVIGFSIFVYTYGSIYPGVTVAGEHKLGGMSMKEAEEYVAKEVKRDVFKQTITVTAEDLVTGEDKSYDIKMSNLAEDINSFQTSAQAYHMGREGGYFQRMSTVLGCIFGGREISLNATLKENAVGQQVEAVAGKLTYKPVEPSWTVDKEAKELHIDTGRPGLCINEEQVIEELAARAENVQLTPYHIETLIDEQEKPDAAAIAADVNAEPQNAMVDKENDNAIIEAVDGVQVTEDEIKAVLGDASEQSYTVPITVTPAKIYKADLEPVLFRDVLGSATTYYNSGLAGRTTNVRLAAHSIDGTVLNPGEEFSYNGTVGERTYARGYRSAIIFSHGKEVDGLGGGVCQVSSTTYMSVLRADLNVTERSSHQFEVSYTPLSQDAAVYWGSKDFRFVNNTDYPVKIVTSVGGGSLTVSIVGTKTEEKKISFSSSSYIKGNYKRATLYKTVTQNGETTTVKENSSAYMLEKR